MWLVQGDVTGKFVITKKQYFTAIWTLPMAVKYPKNLKNKGQYERCISLIRHCYAVFWHLLSNVLNGLLLIVRRYYKIMDIKCDNSMYNMLIFGYAPNFQT